MLFIRERPLLRLEVGVSNPAGDTARWGLDDPNPANQPQNLTFSTAMPGGFESFSCVLARDPRRPWPDLQELSKITIRGVGGEVAWQGRLETLPDTGGAQAQLSPAGSGYQSALNDNAAACMIYVDQNLSTWQGPSLDRQIFLAQASVDVGSNSVAVDPSTNNPAIVLEVDGSWVNGPAAEAWYDAGIAGPIAKLWYSYDPGVDVGAGWNEQAYISANDSATAGLVGSGNLAAGPASGTLTGSGRFALLQHSYTPNAGQDGFAYQSFWRAAVYGNHGLPIYGGPPGGVLASDVIAHALSTWAPEIGHSTGADGTIQPSAFVIPQLVFTSPGTAAAIITQAASYELLDWAIWDGPTFYLNPFGQGATQRNWRCRIGECQLQETGPDIARIFNGVIVEFTGVDGLSYTVGPPGSGAQVTDASLADSDPQNPANQAGITRWALLQMGTSTLINPAGSGNIAPAPVQVGARYLQEQAGLNTAGQASLVGAVQDDHGVYWPAWMVRAGDTLSVIDASDPAPRRVVSTSYDDSSKTNTVQLDQPPDTVDALLARMSDVIGSLGLS